MKQDILIEIEDYEGNTLHLISLEIENKKIINCKSDTLDFADEEQNVNFQHIRLQEVLKK